MKDEFNNPLSQKFKEKNSNFLPYLKSTFQVMKIFTEVNCLFYFLKNILLVNCNLPLFFLMFDF